MLHEDVYNASVYKKKLLLLKGNFPVCEAHVSRFNASKLGKSADFFDFLSLFSPSIQTNMSFLLLQNFFWAGNYLLLH